jgi:2,3,4,5-tetrahydropyridine-2,6-dicarboxylate N-succinyltransferase
MELKELIKAAWADRTLLQESQYSDAVKCTIEAVDKGKTRVAEPGENGWVVNEWVK